MSSEEQLLNQQSKSKVSFGIETVNSKIWYDIKELKMLK